MMENVCNSSPLEVSAAIASFPNPAAIAVTSGLVPLGLAERSRHLLVLSASSDRELEAWVSAYQQHAIALPSLNLSLLCEGANRCQGDLAYRAAFVVGDRADLLAQLRAWFENRTTFNALLGPSALANPVATSRVAFLFTGQGAKYLNMGRQLYLTQPCFRQILDDCDAILRDYLEQPLLSVLYPNLEPAHSRTPTPESPGPATLLDRPEYVQPALFAVEYALARLWQSWGIQPTILMGQSFGEYAAACIAGVFSLEDGLKLIAHRGRLTGQLPAGGGMMAVLAPVAEIEPLLSAELEIAAFNGPRALVLAGPTAALQVAAAQWCDRGIKVKPLSVSHAFHSSWMEPMLAEFATLAAEIDYHHPQLPVVSSVTGREVSTALATPQYWVEQVREPVYFAKGIACLLQASDVFLEIGPQPLLVRMGRQCLPADANPSLVDENCWLPSLQMGQDDWQTILSSLAQLWLRGMWVDWHRVGHGSSWQNFRLRPWPSPELAC